MVDCCGVEVVIDGPDVEAPKAGDSLDVEVVLDSPDVEAPKVGLAP